MKQVVVWGPPGCGKTRNAEALKRFFGCKHVVDGEDFNLRNHRPDGPTLYLTTDASMGLNVAEVHFFADVMRRMQKEAAT